MSAVDLAVLAAKIALRCDDRLGRLVAEIAEELDLDEPPVDLSKPASAVAVWREAHRLQGTLDR
jgi:hypothetical protein